VRFRFWLIIRVELIGEESFRIVLRSIGSNRSRIEANERSVYNAFPCKKCDMGLHDSGKDTVVKVFQKEVKSPIRGKLCRNIKTAIVCNEKVVVKVIEKVGDHGKAFTFHNSKGTDHSMSGKAFQSSKRVFLNKG